MDLRILFLAGLIPVALLIGISREIISRGYPQPVLQRRLLILALAAGVILLGVIGLSAWLAPPGENRASTYLEPFLAPALLAVLVIALVNLRGLAGARRVELVLISLLGLALVGLLFALDDSLGYVPLVLLASLILVVTWKVVGRTDALAFGLSVVVLALLGLYYRRIVIGYPLSGPQWAQTVYRWLGIVPLLAVVLSALLVQLGVQRLPLGQQKPSKSRWRAWLPAVLRFGLAVLLLAGLTYIIVWGSIWDQTSDGLTGVMLSLYCSLLSIGAGVLMTFTSSGRQRLASLVFLVAVPLLLFQAFSLGWRISNLEITARRAARIQRAVERFHAREQWYPGTLDELTPEDLLWVPGPVILSGEGWCYQGGANYYRLGAFYRDYFSTPLLVKIYAEAGTPPETGWECGDRLAEMKARYDIPP